MRQFNMFFALLVTAMLFACQPSDKIETGNELEGFAMIEVETKLVQRGEFNTIEFEKPYAFTSKEDFYAQMIKPVSEGERQQIYERLLLRDSMLFDGVDFDENSVVAMTGLASSYIREINTKLYMKGDELFLDVYVNVADTCRAARKWNALIKIPFVLSGTEKITCKVSTNQPIRAIEPNYINGIGEDVKVNSNKKNSPTFYFYRNTGGPYFIVYNAKRHKEFIEAVNNHPSAILNYAASMFRWWDPTMPSDEVYLINIIRDCEYQEFAHFDEKRYGPIASYNWNRSEWNENDRGYMFPYIYYDSPEGNVLDKAGVSYLCSYLGATYVLQPLDPTPSIMDYITEFVLYDNKKIHHIDMLSIITRHYTCIALPAELERMIVYFNKDMADQILIKRYYDPDLVNKYGKWWNVFDE